MAQRSDRLEAAKAIAARLKAGAAVTEPALEHQRTGTAGAEPSKPTVANGGNQSATYHGTASESGSIPAAVQQPLAISEATWRGLRASAAAAVAVVAARSQSPSPAAAAAA